MTQSNNAPPDDELIRQSLGGDKAALNALVDRHYAVTFNICLKMLYSHPDAEDVNQEIWIKIITQLKSFAFRSTFTTWVYRIAVNHLLDMKKGRVELAITGGFAGYGQHLAGIADQVLNPEEQTVLQEAVAEAKVSCMSGMLMCLDREQRLLYILGDIFKLDHRTGSEIFGTTPANYRQKLSRARQDLFQFMNRQCGLVNPANPCRCAKKTKGFIELGYVDPQKLTFTRGFRARIHDKLLAKEAALEAAREDFRTRLFQGHPYEEKPSDILPRILSDHQLGTLLHLN
jgi:RNA polymerase sigma factor (sigma-70 family)